MNILHQITSVPRYCPLADARESSNKEDQQEDKEADTDDEEEQFDSDNAKKNMPLVCSTKKMSLPNAGEKLPVKHRTNRRRFSSPLWSNRRTERKEDSDISNYALHKFRHLLNPRPTPSHSIGFEGNTSDGSTAGFQANDGIAHRLS